ncbi:hypothetical protein LU631_12100 [Erwinia tracheiphila]|uniref:hypothetical protein n=1 Tax=Erwinia tracheiphila TaxID=65700 RepID=UPI000334E75F|nr:hypothetical protein [Erwinia tracheiphila]EOS93830.1 hypothetical protein ETR_17092 [Erwinia tracheiphila PSU-1]UIA89804.1 hypothetical protein LU631_12100 [Erwinia tracheiphila]UIA98106.1 hypothetical protein LU633_10305 [Erwinia tracheiphila]
MNNSVMNPFGQPAVQNQQAGVVAIEQHRAMQEVQAALVVAKKFPRDPVAAMDRILTACTRPTLAEGALYSYARGGTDVTGPSIRLAEAIAQNWGNLQFGVRELEQRNGESIVEAFAWDVETNTRQIKTFTVPHIRYTRKGTQKLVDPRDIYELVASQGARRLRACILGVVPGDVVESAQRQCETTMATNFEITPEFIQSLISSFEKLGVTKEQLEKRIQCRAEAIRPAQVVQLKKIQTSIKDGMSTASGWFEVSAPSKSGTADLNKLDIK